MPDNIALNPVRFAELIAPVITRTFVSGMKAAAADGRELVASYGRDAIGYLVDLRNPLAAGRSLSRDDLAAVYRYTDPDTVHNTVKRSVDHGLLDQAPDGSVSASPRGHAFLSDLYALHGRVLADPWESRSGFLEPANTLVHRVMDAAADSAGDAWAAQAPPHEPDGTSQGVLLLNRLSTMRYHRADAHAAAWQAAGLTAAEMVAMPWGTEWSPARQAVENDTNVRASAPYAVLSADERLTLLASLAALP